VSRRFGPGIKTESENDVWSAPMAALALHHGTVTLGITRNEHVEEFRRDLTAPRTAVSAVRVVDNLDAVAGEVTGATRRS
jgi:hypothetical protein